MKRRIFLCLAFLRRACNSIVVATLILVAGLLLAVWLYTERTAYDVVSVHGHAYLLNRKTGRTWLLVVNKRKPVTPDMTVSDFLLSPGDEKEPP